MYFFIKFIIISFDQETLLFLDEIQAYGDAFKALKFLSEDFRCDIVYFGNIPGITVTSSSSFPVGYVET